MFAASSKTASVSGGYQISRSLRFNSADSAYLNRTPATTTNRRTWTWSGWIKRSNLSVLQALFGSKQGVAGTPRAGIQIEDTDALTFIYNSTGSANSQITTTAVYRDVSAWYHIILAVDTTQATNTNRLKLYVNGVQVTVFSTADYPTLNEDLPININTAHMIGSFDPAAGADRYFRGYMTEVNFIDGQQLTPSSFGETNAQTGVWQPKAYSGSYGTNGFYLNFSDNSNTTAATLGKDYSGNGNNWTPNNFSVTAGAGNDSLVDSPTSYGTDTGVGGTVRGNYATLNPLDYSPYVSLLNGNLDYTISSNQKGFRKATISASSGKWYAECLMTSSGNIVGIATADTDPMAGSGYVGATSTSWGYDGANGRVYNNAASSAYGATYTTNDVIGIALDLDAGTLVFYKNGTSQGTAATGLSGTFTFATGQAGSGVTGTVNFGQRPFAYTAPSGFKALCTQNLPTPTIGATTATQAGKYFNPVLYTGTGSSLGVTGVGFQPDWVWVKGRSGATDHGLYDAVRGVQKQLESNGTGAETTETTGITAFGSDGFTTGALAQLNTSSATYVAWNWKANGSGSSNTAGSITSTVSANTTSGFSVVTYTGTGATASVGHGLGALPQMIIVKRRNSTGDWAVYHRTLGANTYLVLNSTAASASVSGYWQYTPSPGNPTVDWFGIIAGYDVNVSSATYVAYCFAEVAGYSKFGSYTGNGSADGPFVFTGFRPAYLLLKNTTTAGNSWHILDVARGTYNVQGPELRANESVAESVFTIGDFVSNGFKLRDTNQAWNKSGDVYIYMAFASNPFKYSLAR